jgi:RNA polymerase sigma-70 factor (ECF subfamily)
MKERPQEIEPNQDELSTPTDINQEEPELIQTDFLTQDGNNLLIPVQPSIFGRVKSKLEDKQYSLTKIGAAFAVVTAVGITAKLISKRKKEPQKILLLTEEQQERYDAMYENSYPDVYSFFRFRGFSHPDAENITQEVFLRAFRAFPKFIPHPEKYEKPYHPWLYTIARNLRKNDIRRAKRRVRESSLDEITEGYKRHTILRDLDTDIELDVEALEKLRNTGDAVTHLPVNYQLVIWLKKFIPLTNKEIAEVIYDDIKKEGAVKSLFDRAMKALGREVDKIEKKQSSQLKIPRK